jgi:hypothetical protein
VAYISAGQMGLDLVSLSVGLDESGRLGANPLSIRPVASVTRTRVAPIEAVAEVVEPEREHRVSVRVELVAAEPPGPQIVCAPLKSLPPQASLESDAAQLTAAATAARLAHARGFHAYAASRDLLDANALARGVCLHRDA